MSITFNSSPVSVRLDQFNDIIISIHNSNNIHIANNSAQPVTVDGVSNKFTTSVGGTVQVWNPRESISFDKTVNVLITGPLPDDNGVEYITLTGETGGAPRSVKIWHAK